VNFVPNNYNPLYYKNPFEFNPERWIDTKAAPHPFAFVPFSSGPRNCIGQHFAVMEAKLIMTKLMQNYDWCIERPEDVSFTIGFVTKPS
jgi:cytochrome P450